MSASEALGVGPAPLRATTSAVASDVGRLRRAVRDWLARVECDEDTADDLVLATSEALENCVDHAFVSADAPGTMSVGAELVDGTVIIVVTDDGTWRAPDDDPGHRGRGLALIHAIATEARVSTVEVGTTVTIRRRVHTASSVPHQRR